MHAGVGRYRRGTVVDPSTLRTSQSMGALGLARLHPAERLVCVTHHSAGIDGAVEHTVCSRQRSGGPSLLLPASAVRGWRARIGCAPHRLGPATERRQLAGRETRGHRHRYRDGHLDQHAGPRPEAGPLGGFETRGHGVHRRPTQRSDRSGGVRGRSLHPMPHHHRPSGVEGTLRRG